MFFTSSGSNWHSAPPVHDFLTCKKNVLNKSTPPFRLSCPSDMKYIASYFKSLSVFRRVSSIQQAQIFFSYKIFSSSAILLFVARWLYIPSALHYIMISDTCWFSVSVLFWPGPLLFYLVAPQNWTSLIVSTPSPSCCSGPASDCMLI